MKITFPKKFAFDMQKHIKFFKFHTSHQKQPAISGQYFLTVILHYVIIFVRQGALCNDGSVVHELVQLNESFNWTNWTSSQFWRNELVHSFNELWLDELWDCDELMTFLISIKLNGSFPGLPPKSAYFFDFIIFLVLFVKKYIDFCHKLGIQRIKSKKYVDFDPKSRKLVIQIKVDLKKLEKHSNQKN